MFLKGSSLQGFCGDALNSGWWQRLWGPRRSPGASSKNAYLQLPSRQRNERVFVQTGITSRGAARADWFGYTSILVAFVRIL